MNFKPIILSIIFFLPFQTIAQIISRDTVCVGDTVLFSADTSLKHIQYCWEFGTRSLTPILTTATAILNTGTSGNLFNTVAQATMVYDSSTKKFHAFASVAGPLMLVPRIQRLDFGANPNGIPTTVDLGNPFNIFINTSNTNMEGIEFVKDNQGIFHAFIANGGIVHLMFGNGIANPPTQAVRIYSDRTILRMPMQLSIIHYNHEWILFAGQTYGPSAIVRFDLGADLNNIPATLPATSLNVPGTTDVSYFAIIQQTGNWHMFFTNLNYSGSTPLRRFDFGANLKNNTPTLTNLGTFTPAIITCRGMNFIKSCDTFFLLSLNEDGNVLAYDFKNNITSIPTTRSLGAVYGTGLYMQVLKPYWYNDTLWAISSSYGNNPISTIYRFPLLAIPSGNAVIKYWNPDTTYIFRTPGLYNITLYCDQADPRGPQSYCKQVFVKPIIKNFLGPDTLLCGIPTYVADAGISGLSNWLWNTGATTPAITASVTGTYHVQALLNGCPVKDTIAVRFENNPIINLGPDTQLCSSQSLVLGPGGTFSSPVYSWNTGATTAQIPVSQSGSYALTVNDKGCKASDTVIVTVNLLPNANLGNDIAICETNLPITLAPLNIPPVGTTYQWSNGLFTPQIQVNQGGSFWLKLTANNCSDADTISITATTLPRVDLGSDSTICADTSLRIGKEISGATYDWNTGATTPYINVSKTGNYVLSVKLNGCVVDDTIQIMVMPLPVLNLGDNRNICNDQIILLDATSPDAITYLWNTNATTPVCNAVQDGTYWVRVTSKYGCNATDTVFVHHIPRPIVAIGNDTLICEGTSITLHALVANADSSYWINGSTVQSLVVSKGGTFVAVATNECGSSSDTIVVHEVPCNIWLPDAFTPNGDGKNDYFKILGNVAALEKVNLNIYNRWGNLVFNTGDKYEGWDGRHKGSDAMLGVYFYFLQYQKNGESYILKGDVTLVR